MRDTAIEAVKSAPPLTVGTLTLLGISLSDWTLILTATYTSVLLFVLVRDKIWRPWRDGKRLRDAQQQDK